MGSAPLSSNLRNISQLLLFMAACRGDIPNLVFLFTLALAERDKNKPKKTGLLLYKRKMYSFCTTKTKCPNEQ